MAKFDYKKITLKEMVDWVTENEEKLAKDKKDLLVSFLSIALGEQDKKQTLQAKKPFYDLAKDYVEFMRPAAFGSAATPQNSHISQKRS